MFEISKKEAIEAIRKLKIGKAHGLDERTPETIKGEEWIKQVTDLINDSKEQKVTKRMEYRSNNANIQ